MPPTYTDPTPVVVATITLTCVQYNDPNKVAEFDERWTRQRERALANVVAPDVFENGVVKDYLLVPMLNVAAQYLLDESVRSDHAGADGLYGPFVGGSWKIGSGGLHEGRANAYQKVGANRGGLWELINTKATMLVHVRWSVGSQGHDVQPYAGS